MKNVLALVALLFGVIDTSAQGMVFNLHTGYAFGCSFDAFHSPSNHYSASIKPGRKYSLDAGYKVDRNFSVNLSLQYQKTILHADAQYNGTRISPNLQMALLWVQVGGTSHLPLHHVELFFGTYVGAGLYRFSDLPTANQTAPVRLAWSFRGGFAYFVTKQVGINVRTDALFSLDPLTEQFTTPGLMEGETGFNSFFQYGLSLGVTVQLFRGAGKAQQ